MKWLIVLLNLLSLVLCFEPDVTLNTFKDVATLILYFDDSPNILSLRDNGPYLSKDDGKTWNKVDLGSDDKILNIMSDPFYPKRAFALTETTKQYYTVDQGQSWNSFEFDEPIDYVPKISFNAANPDYMLFDYYFCPVKDKSCNHYFYYTDNGLKTNPKLLSNEARYCVFTKSNKAFIAGQDSSMICALVKLDSFGYVVLEDLVHTDDWLANRKPVTDPDNLILAGTTFELTVIESFVVLVLQSDKYNKKSKLTLLVSKDGKNFKKSDINTDLQNGIYKFLPSTPDSIYISKIDFSSSVGQMATSDIFASDSSGLKFNKILSNVEGGFMSALSVEKVQNIAGVWLGNIAMQKGTSFLESDFIRTKITFDSGKTWSFLKVNGNNDCVGDEKCSLNLLTASERDGNGKFVTGPTPGILLGVGSLGNRISDDYMEYRTFISRDGGLSWDIAIDEACSFAFGDQGNVIVGTPYFGRTNFTTSDLFYSLDQGKSFQKYELKTPIYPLTLTTTIDGTSKKFLLSGLQDETPENPMDYEYTEILYALDFSKAFSKTCGDDDFEDFYVRKSSEDQDPLCLSGKREKFRRRKQDSQCFVNKLYEDVKTIEEDCVCSKSDYECGTGYNKVPDSDECVLDKNTVVELCEGKKVLELTNRVKSANNLCSANDDLKDYVKKEVLNCDDYRHTPDFKPIAVSLTEFKGDIVQYNYLDKFEIPGDCLIAKTDTGDAYVSCNGGLEFDRVEIDDEVIAFYLSYQPEEIFLVTASQNLYISRDGGRRFIQVKTPTLPNRLGSRALTFNKKDRSQIIWYGDEGCDNQYSDDCRLVAYISTDAGYSFSKMASGIRTCDFAVSFLDGDYDDNDKLIYCQFQKSEGLYDLIASKDHFQSDKQQIFSDIVGYAMSGRFMVVATIDKDSNSLSAKVSVDGLTFADAKFPHNFHVDRQQAYTILDSSTKSVFMHVTTNANEGSEFGAILKSNSNGTSYVLSVENVNRNRAGYVDFEKVESLEGVAVVNIVSNANEVKSGANKKLQTQITHNDGGEWNYLTPPVIDSENNRYECTSKGGPEKCTLNLHGYTERDDYRDTYSSTSATGVLIGTGNVGPYLTSQEDASTFMTSDGGVTWKEIRKGVYMWEYGDRGTILVLVKAREKTSTIVYSLDEGATWLEYQFSDAEVNVIDLATVPSDTSRKFTIFAKGSGTSTLAFSIDFTNIHIRQCNLDLDNPNKDDFEFWTPKHPYLSDNCLFGHEARYLRRISYHNDCFIGNAPLAEGFKIIRNCSCTRRDYECDYNYYRADDGTCKLVQGLSALDPQEVCQKRNVFEYFEPTGYRKIPLSTCEKGQEFDKWYPKACPGREGQFNKEHGREVGGWNAILVIFVPLFVFCFATWFVYDRGIRRNGGFARFGQIRLDDDDGFQPIEENNVDVVVNKIVKGGIVTVGGIWKAVKVILSLDKMLFDRVRDTITGRNRRNDYASVRPMNLDEDDELFFNFEENAEDDDAQEIDSFIQPYEDDAHDIASNENFNIDDDEEDAGNVEFDADRESAT